MLFKHMELQIYTCTNIKGNKQTTLVKFQVATKKVTHALKRLVLLMNELMTPCSHTIHP